MSKIEKLKDQTAIVPINDADLAALTNAARDLTPTEFVGLPLLFRKGPWLIKQDKDNEVRVRPEDRFVVDMCSYAEGWKRFVGKKFTYRLMGRRVDGFVSPSRDRLPEADPKEWPIGPKGPEDPWKEFQEFVLRQADTDQLLTWSISSWGGRLAISKLLEDFLAETRQHPGEMPIVELSSYDRPHAEFGKVPTPQLEIVGWEPFGPDASPPGDPSRLKALQQALQSLHTLVLPKPAAPAKREDMDDEIPF